MRVFDTDLSLTLKRKDYVSLRDCVEYVKDKLGWDTANIKAVKHDGREIKNNKLNII